MTPPGELELIGLMPVFTPKQAAELLRSIGLEGITECALRTRAYRKQIPFHLNGRRVIFTAADLREIAEGQAVRPRADDNLDASEEPIRTRTGEANAPWRARRRRDG